MAICRASSRTSTDGGFLVAERVPAPAPRTSEACALGEDASLSRSRQQPWTEPGRASTVTARCPRYGAHRKPRAGSTVSGLWPPPSHLTCAGTRHPRPRSPGIETARQRIVARNLRFASLSRHRGRCRRSRRSEMTRHARSRTLPAGTAIPDRPRDVLRTAPNRTGAGAELAASPCDSRGRRLGELRHRRPPPASTQPAGIAAAARPAGPRRAADRTGASASLRHRPACTRSSGRGT